jgi:hypothetical protein
VTESHWWDRHKAAVLDGFVLSNVAFLVADVYLAHSVNRFRHPVEWLPVGFSLIATLVLAPAVALRVRGQASGFVRASGVVIGWAAIALGLAGVSFHLDSQFFARWTVESLVYTAPFVAPLAYAGLGFLLLLNRMIPSRRRDWGQWVVFFALGGFAGNFVLALCDHAMNGFFHPTEWLPVGASALAVGFLTVALVEQRVVGLRVWAVILALQVVVGLAGFYVHLVSDVNGLSSSLFENFVHGAPVFAPLLCVDMVVLAAIGLWDMYSAPQPA